METTNTLVSRSLPAAQDLESRKPAGGAGRSAWSQQEPDTGSEHCICGQRGPTASSGVRRVQGGVQRSVRPGGEPTEVEPQPRGCPAGNTEFRALGNDGPEQGSPHPHPEGAWWVWPFTRWPVSRLGHTRPRWGLRPQAAQDQTRVHGDF